MREVPATEFARNFSRYREIVQREPIAVTAHGHVTGYFVSTVEYEKFQRIKALSRRSVRTVDLTEAEIDEMLAGRMSPEHDHLNALLDKE